MWVVVLTDFLDLLSALSGLSSFSFVTYKQLGIDCCPDKLCVLRYLQCSPQASCYLEQVAGGSCLEIALIYAQA